jgi:acetoin:2,6-dichlorophenolindophenol oxidoreductase subunit beta
MREITYRQAASEAIAEEFRANPKTIHLSAGGAADLVKEFGPARIRNASLSESAIVGTAIGLAGSGFRTVASIGMATFGFVAMDQFFNQAAKITYMFGGQAKFPILYRMSSGLGSSAAAQHSINPYSMFMHVSGLKVILPSTPRDLKGLLKTALRDDNPVICFEHMGLGGVKGEVPDEEYSIPFGVANTVRKGIDVTVVALSKMVYDALAVADRLAKEGISVEVIDPRTLVPMDKDAIKKSVARTGRLVVVDEAVRTCGAAGEILASVVEDEDVFSMLKAPVRRVCGTDVPVPFSPPLEEYVVPNQEKIASVIRRVVSHRRPS